MITLYLDTKSGLPVYIQIMRQIKQALHLGILQVGDRLPTVKEAAAMMVVNPNTVFKAYQELEKEGIIDGKIGSGTFIAKVLEAPSPAIRTKLLAMLREWIETAQASGLDYESTEALMKMGLHNIAKESHERHFQKPTGNPN